MVNRVRLLSWVAATMILMAASSAATWGVLQMRDTGRVPASLGHSPQFARFVDTYELIRHESIWHTTTRQLLLGATNGMVHTLGDKFSHYLTARQAFALDQELDPEYSGVGVALTLTEPPVVVSVFGGSPAARAGIRPGEALVSINGHSTATIEPGRVTDLLRGSPGTRVTLGVKMGARERTVVLRRQEIVVPTVYTRLFPGGIAYLDIAEFGMHTGTQVARAFHRLMRHHPQGLILDLRDNPGGEVSQALAVANLLVPKGPVVTLKYKNRSEDVTYDSKGPGTKLPVVVLVNGGTASAAEILAAAIQERQGGKLVGTRTYGKGIVQAVIPLSGGAFLKLTVARYYTPNGDYIEHVGLKPNVRVVEPSGIVASDSPAADPQLRAAIRVLRQMMAHMTGRR